MTDFYLFVILFCTGLGLQTLGLGLQACRLRQRARGLQQQWRESWRSPIWWLWAAGVGLILGAALRDRDLVLAGGQAMGAVVLHRWLFR